MSHKRRTNSQPSELHISIPSMIKVRAHGSANHTIIEMWSRPRCRWISSSIPVQPLSGAPRHLITAFRYPWKVRVVFLSSKILMCLRTPSTMPPPSRAERWRERARQLKTEAHAVYLASRDPRVPWPTKLLAACVVAYLFSPIDLIPDFIPVLGYLDDLIVVPAGLMLVIKLIPANIMQEHREAARIASLRRKPNWVAAMVIVTIWIVVLLIGAALIYRHISGAPLLGLLIGDYPVLTRARN